MKQLLTLFICISFSSTWAQLEFSKVNYLEVSENGKEMTFPWVGGLTNPQFSNADINQDGIADLVAFDKVGGVVVPWISGGTPNTIDFHYAHEYAANFPHLTNDTVPSRNWMLLQDMDCDGIEDVLSSSTVPNKIYFYKGRYTADSMITFDYTDFLQYTSLSGNQVNIFVSALDIPALADMNGDGDIDVLTFNILGGKIDYYENQSMELTGTCGDTVTFLWYDDCWGNVFESGQNQSLRLLDTCRTFLRPFEIAEETNNPGVSGNPRHAGSTNLAFDEDGDGDMDLLLGDLNFTKMTMLYNGGTADSSKITWQDTTYPSASVPVDMDLFLASYLADVNNDGLEDLLIAPNTPKPANNYDCIWHYENVGDTSVYEWEFKTDTFLNLDNIDLGEDAYPVFFDHNNDGLLDIVAGNFGYYTNGVSYVSSLILIENVGDSLFPKFNVVTRDYAGIASLGLEGVYPTFGDLDGDGDKDLVIGYESGELLLFRNTATAGSPANFVLDPDPQYQKIDVGQNASPFLYDLNADGLLDMLVGSRGGIISYFQNTGTLTDAVFSSTATNTALGEILVRPSGSTVGLSRPYISKLDSASQEFLIVGNVLGDINVYLINPDSIYEGSFKPAYESFSNIDVGRNSAIAIADLDANNRLEMLVGTSRGGIELFSQSDTARRPPLDTTSIVNIRRPDSFDLNIFPNPAENLVNLSWIAQNSNNTSIILYDAVGRVVAEKDDIEGISYQLDISDQSAGFYLLQLQIGNKSVVKKLLIH